jgi:hypothetical protein
MLAKTFYFKFMKISIVLLFFLFLSCNSKDLKTDNDLLKREISGLKKELKNIKKDIQVLNKNSPKIVVNTINDLTIFEPNGLKINIKSIKPIKSDNTYLCIPAAFTDSANKIDGLFIENGNNIGGSLNEKLTGACIISDNKIQFANYSSLNDKLLKEVISKKYSLFQQQLLVFNSKIIKCDLFKGRLNLRRALVEINSHYYLVESKNRVSILDFQSALIKSKVSNAIYLDMGTYSEGWFKNEDKKNITIGETMTQTNRQSNWIVFEATNQR